jgi:hypothetical protein
MVQGAMATEPQMRASLPGATGPDRMQNRTDSAVLAKAREVQADIESATRKARVGPVAREADIAAQQAAEEYRQTMPFQDRTDRLMNQDAARQQVYNQAGVVSPADAFTGESANALALGIPAIANKDFRGFLAQAQSDQPLSSLGGQAIGFLAPAAAGWSATTQLGSDTRPIAVRLGRDFHPASAVR